MEFQIITDGSCDLGEELVKKNEIKVVPFYVSFNETDYYKEIEEIPVRKFYQKMIANPTLFPKSSLPAVQDYIEAFTPFVKQKIPILCICITTKFSGSYNSANNAKIMLKEIYADAEITVMDAAMNTVLQGIFVLEAARMKKNGYSYKKTIRILEQIRPTGRIFFTIDSMDYLVNGGRVGKLMGLAASTLGIKPLIQLKEGEIFPNGITRNRNKAKQKLIQQTKEYFQDINKNPDNYIIVVGYGYDKDEAIEFRDNLLDSIKSYSNIKNIDIFQIGATIGVHTGPYPIGIGLLQRYESIK